MRRALAIFLLLVLPAAATAGMAAPLPVDPARTWRLTDVAHLRLQAVSFFLLLFFLSALAVKLLWNELRKDFPSLPRLSYPRAVGFVFLWGLLVVIVLAMIAGARELMTPGAWKRDGPTYRLDTEPARPDDHPEASRRQQLERLRTALWQFAATHGGRFPSDDEVSAIPPELWQVPDGGGLRFVYVPGRVAGHLPDILAYEPELDPERRLVLDATGDIWVMRSADLTARLAGGIRP